MDKGSNGARVPRWIAVAAIVVPLLSGSALAFADDGANERDANGSDRDPIVHETLGAIASMGQPGPAPAQPAVADTMAAQAVTASTVDVPALNPNEYEH